MILSLDFKRLIYFCLNNEKNDYNFFKSSKASDGWIIGD